jgi:hypothetical protein
MADRRSPPAPGIRLAAAALIAATAFVGALCWIFAPQWETNDDVAMSMIVHGYGIAAPSTPNLIFSNVLWGYLVRAIPTINGMLGYSSATLAVLVGVGAVLIYGLYRLGAGLIVAFLAVVLIMARPILFPQFTINAGLLLLGAILCWHLYARWNDWRALAIGCALAFASYLVRNVECLLVLIVSLPLLPWTCLRSRPAAWLSLAALVAAVAAAAYIDHEAYQGPAWQVFNALHEPRALFTDFRIGEVLKLHPEILARHRYSANDIDLLGAWFFVDPTIADPQTLMTMVDELGPRRALDTGWAGGWAGVEALWHPNLLPVVLAALVVAMLRPQWRVAAAWVLCVAAVFALGFLGRPGVLRVYVPVVSLLLVAPLLMNQEGPWRRRAAAGVLAVAAVVNSVQLFSQSRAAEAVSQKLRQDMVSFPSDLVVVWGGAFPYEALYPVLGASSSAMSYRLYGLGGVTLAPFSDAVAEESAGRGLINRLLSEEGLSVTANERNLVMLDGYCREHLHGELKRLSAQRYGEVLLNRLRCAPPS